MSPLLFLLLLQLPTMYPGLPVILHVNATEVPLFSFKPDSILFDPKTTIKAFAIQKNGTLTPLFLLSLVRVQTVLVFLWKRGLALLYKFTLYFYNYFCLSHQNCGVRFGASFRPLISAVKRGLPMGSWKLRRTWKSEHRHILQWSLPLWAAPHTHTKTNASASVPTASHWCWRKVKWELSRYARQGRDQISCFCWVLLVITLLNPSADQCHWRSCEEGDEVCYVSA